MILARVAVAKNIKSVMEAKANTYYRVVVDGIGIYEAVDNDCPKDDPRREVKPDGSWLAKKGIDFPGSISYWTAAGFQKYNDSGLFDWHRSVVDGVIEISTTSRPDDILYEDEYQILIKAKCPCGTGNNTCHGS